MCPRAQSVDSALASWKSPLFYAWFLERRIGGGPRLTTVKAVWPCG